MKRLRRAVVLSVKAMVPAGTAVYWAPTDEPRRPSLDPTAAVTCRIATPATPGASVESTEEAVTKAVITLFTEDLVVGELVGFTAGGRTFSTEVGAGDTASDVIGRLVSAFDVDGVASSTQVITGTGWGGTYWGDANFGAGAGMALTLDSTAIPGLLGNVSVFGQLLRLYPVTAIAHTSYAISSGVVEVQAYAAGRGLEAHSLLHQFVAGLPLLPLQRIRLEHGVWMEPAGDLIDLTALAGGDWESRAAVRLRFSMRTRVSVAEYPITALDFSLNDGEIAGSVP